MNLEKYKHKHITENITCICGDSLDVLKELEDNSIDSIVTDSPYGLSKDLDAVEVMKAWIETGFYDLKNRTGFMGKKWDAFVPQPILWKECFRVLKPGGHLLTFAGTRTQDWMGMSLRFVGFEIRDCIAFLYDKDKRFKDFWDTLDSRQRKELQNIFNSEGLLHWTFGSGFPKSLDISKSLDKHFKKEREIIGKRLDGKGNDSGSGCYEMNNGKSKMSKEIDITIPATPEAKKWDGWGSALKPACEPIIMCRKPLSEKNIASNVLRWGVGGINIDGCRVDSKEDLTRDCKGWASSKHEGYKRPSYINAEKKVFGSTKGRFPSNLILSDCEEVKKMFPDGKSSKGSRGGQGFHNAFGRPDKTRTDGNIISGYTDQGSAARFFKQIDTSEIDPIFYCAKASKSDRNEGLEELKEKQTTGGGGGVGDYLNDVNSASGKYGSEKAPSKNHHPTVKPTALMQYLVRLVTPPKGIVLDPFAGSFSTGKACVKEGFGFIGIDLMEEYYDIGIKRIEHELKQGDLFR
jgi:site-specific DNA-methyltransferase (adenine-specific)